MIFFYFFMKRISYSREKIFFRELQPYTCGEESRRFWSALGYMQNKRRPSPEFGCCWGPGEELSDYAVIAPDVRRDCCSVTFKFSHFSQQIPVAEKMPTQQRFWVGQPPGSRQ